MDVKLFGENNSPMGVGPMGSGVGVGFSGGEGVEKQGIRRLSRKNQREVFRRQVERKRMPDCPFYQ